jgi:predicted acetyltransferase
LAALPRYGPIIEGELVAVSRILSHAFAFPPEQAGEWFQKAGLDQARILRSPAGPVGCLMRLPMGQYFGGRDVPMLGIAGVGVAPEARGQGLALELMRQAVLEAHAEGFALSCLYASTQALYRQVGYEQAGHRFFYRLPLATIGVRERTGALVPLTLADHPAVEECYRAFAREHNGAVARGRYVWGRVRELRGETFHGFGVPRPGGGLDGYIFITQRRSPTTFRQEIGISDMAFLTAEAGRRILGFLADFGTIGDEAQFFAGPHHLILMLMGQQRFKSEFKDYWMVRVTDVKAALESRGYPDSLDAEISLHVADELVPENSGAWTLRVRDGAGLVERKTAARAGLSLDAGALAALYCGFLSPGQLRLIGRAQADARSESMAAAVFAGPTPGMSEMF